MDENLRARILGAADRGEFPRFLAILIHQLTEVARASYAGAKGKGEAAEQAFGRLQVVIETINIAGEKLVRGDNDGLAPAAVLDAMLEKAGDQYAGGIENIMRLAASGLSAPTALP